MLRYVKPHQIASPQLITREPPLKHIVHNIDVAHAVVTGARPNRPQRDYSAQISITDDFWVLLQRCWPTEPEARPTMAAIAASLQDLDKLFVDDEATIP